MKYVIDGLFLTQQLTGIQRYAFEIFSELDKLVENDFIEILVPENTQVNINLKNIKIKKFGKLTGIPWRQIDFAYYLKKNKLQAVCLTNDIPLIYPHGIAVIHDVSYKANPQFFTTFRARMSALLRKINYKRVFSSKMKLITVSEFSKSEINKYYNVSPDKITVIYNAWQHMNKVDFGKNTFEKYPQLKDKEYYFSMCTLAPNKNLKWILNAAQNNKDKIFAVAGGGKLKNVAENCNIPNVYFLGYVSDEDAKTLMANCKAFIFPTLYEGFGIPPLEAIACGAKNIFVSDTPCMREIYGNYANYIDLNSDNYEIFNNCITTDKSILNNYSWKESAEQFYYNIISY